jgi:glycosyltransferase involved in cell wall biosynthesis
VSSATKEQCLKRGIPRSKIVVIPNGISDDFHIREDVQKLNDRLCKKVKINLRNRKMILSVGRIVERKGFHWFVTNVLPKIVMEERDVVFLLAGEGPFKGTIEKSIINAGMRKHVILLGKVDNETLRLLYNSSHVMVVPNIPVEGDIEGFGVVVLEATSCGLPLVASGTEGIREAIVHGENGFLVETFNAEKFSRTLLFILENSRRAKVLGEKARRFTLRNFAWEKIAKMYFKILSRTAPYNCAVNLSPSSETNSSRKVR